MTIKSWKVRHFELFIFQATFHPEVRGIYEENETFKSPLVLLCHKLVLELTSHFPCHSEVVQVLFSHLFNKGWIWLEHMKTELDIDSKSHK